MGAVHVGEHGRRPLTRTREAISAVKAPFAVVDRDRQRALRAPGRVSGRARRSRWRWPTSPSRCRTPWPRAQCASACSWCPQGYERRRFWRPRARARTRPPLEVGVQLRDNGRHAARPAGEPVPGARAGRRPRSSRTPLRTDGDGARRRCRRAESAAVETVKTQDGAIPADRFAFYLNVVLLHASWPPSSYASSLLMGAFNRTDVLRRTQAGRPSKQRAAGSCGKRRPACW